MSFGDRLREARIDNKLTQEQLAEQIGVAKSTLTGYEKGNREPNMATIQKIMQVLAIDANYLWQDEMDSSGGFSFNVSYEEMEHVKKYRTLDEHGKELVDMVLDKETKRVTPLKMQSSTQSRKTTARCLTNAEMAKIIAEIPETPEELERLYPPVPPPPSFKRKKPG